MNKRSLLSILLLLSISTTLTMCEGDIPPRHAPEDKTEKTNPNKGGDTNAMPDTPQAENPAPSQPEEVTLELSSTVWEGAPTLGGTFELTVTTDKQWSATCESSWVTVTPSSGTGKTIVQISVQPNNGTSEQKANVIFSTGEAESKTVVITQAGKNIVPLKADNTSFSSVAASGEVLVVNITSSEQWTASPSDTWISASPNQGNNGKMEIRVEANTTTSPRSGSVRLTTGDGQTETIDITQTAKPTDDEVTWVYKNALLEEATGEHCPQCPYGAEIIHELSQKYGERFYVIAYHAPGLYCDYGSPLANEHSRSRQVSFGSKGYPHAAVNKCPDASFLSRGSWASRVAYELNEKTPVQIAITPKWNGNTLHVTATVQGIKEAYKNHSDLRIQIDLVENDIVGYQAGYGSECHHQHVFRGPLNGDGTNGDRVTADQNQYTGQMTIKDSWNKKNLQVIVYVYSRREYYNDDVLQVEGVNL